MTGSAQAAGDRSQYSSRSRDSLNICRHSPSRGCSISRILSLNRGCSTSRCHISPSRFGSAAVLVVGILGFRKGGWFRSKDEPGKESVVQDDKDGQADLEGRPTTYDGENSIDALLDYADRLEKAGNEEAAAIVRSKIPQAAAGEANQKLQELKQDASDFQVFEDVHDALDVFRALEGGN